MKINLSEEEQEKLLAVGCEVSEKVDIEETVYAENYENWKRTLPLSDHPTWHLKAIASVLWSDGTGQPKPVRADDPLRAVRVEQIKAGKGLARFKFQAEVNQEELIQELGKAETERKHTVTQMKEELNNGIKSVCGLMISLFEKRSKEEKKRRKWFIVVQVAIFVTLLWLIFAPLVHAQFSRVNYIEWRQDGTIITDGFFSYPVVIDCTTNLTCTSDGIVVTIVASGGGAPTGADYLVLTLDGTLTAERNFTSGIGIGFTDGGANAAYDIFLDTSELTANQTFWTGASATRTITFSLSGATDPVFNFGDNLFNVTNAVIQQGGTAVVLTSRLLTGGVGIAAIGDLSADRTITFAPAEVAAVTWLDNADRAWTFDIAAAGTNPVISFSSGIVNLSTGAWQEGGNAVPNATDNLSFFTSTSAQFFTGISNETGGTFVVGSDSPVFTTLITVPQEVQFNEAAGDPACVAGEFWLAANGQKFFLFFF